MQATCGARGQCQMARRSSHPSRQHALRAHAVAGAVASPQRRVHASLAHLAFSTPGQFSSFYGSHLWLPAVHIVRSRLTAGIAGKMPAQMSFFGVGAPEALLVGVVALVVFGPKGLADAARSIGTTLRAFQPTIKEVVEVSQDIKGTLEKELGLDELRDAARVPLRPRSDAMSAFQDPDIEAKRRAAAAMAWGDEAPQPTASSASGSGGSAGEGPGSAGVASGEGGPGRGAVTQQAGAQHAGSAGGSSNEAGSKPTGAGTAAQVPAAGSAPALSDMSVEELQAELARRQQQQQGASSSTSSKSGSA